MAAGAGDFVIVVAAAMPGGSDIALMAAKAHSVLHTDGSSRVGAESDNWRTFLPAAYATCVVSAWSVAGFTLQLSAAKRTVRIGRDTMRRVENGHRRCRVMARDAGVGAAAAIRRFRVVR